MLRSTLRSQCTFRLQPTFVPLVEALRSEVPGERDEVFVSSLEGSPTLTLRAWTESEAAAEKLEQELRLRVHAQLRERGVFA